ncbi:MAG: ABC transporter permease [Alphaproteobacteria bacterium]|nr:ABC transporter permease [Alphaproteobacteria bacterium]
MLKPTMPSEEALDVRAPIRGFRIDPVGAFQDIWDGCQKWRIWTALSWQEFKSTYRRSVFGILWVTLSFAAFVFIKLIIFSSLLTVGVPGYYDTFLLLGFFTWFYLSQSVSGSPETFISAQGWVRSESLPLSIYVFKAVLREVYGLLLTAVVVVLGVIYIGYSVSVSGVAVSLLAIPFYMLTAFSVKMFLGIISARYRDLSHLVKAVMMPMMFLTPIFWMPSQMAGLMKYLWWNPFYHYIELFRAPILDNRFPVESWLFAVTFYLLLSMTGILLFSRFRHRIVFWF